MRDPRLIPAWLALAYLALLAVRFPRVIAWLTSNADNDVGYVIADAVAHGHTGHVTLSTQGAWPSLAFAVLTRGLPGHELLWELAPALLVLGSAVLIGACVYRLAGFVCAALTVAVIVAASPTGLFNLASAWFHNTTLPGVALLGAFMIWANLRRRSPRAVVPVVIGLSLITGVLMSGDGLLLPAGLIPLVLTSAILAVRLRDPAVALPAVAIAAGAGFVAMVTSAVAHRLGLATTALPLRVDPARVGLHLRWLGDGLLRFGNGLGVTAQPAVRDALTLAAAVVTVAALVAMARLAAGSVRTPGAGLQRARSAHVIFWACSLAVVAVSDVLTVVVPSDRYFLIAIPAVAATVPLCGLGRPRNLRLVVIGVTVFVSASLISLAAGDAWRASMFPGSVGSQAGRLESLVSQQRLGIGYAGYWDAIPLRWRSAGRLDVFPVMADQAGRLAPANLGQVAAWYRPRAHTSSYLLLTPADSLLPDRMPAGLPRPARVLRLGWATILAYRFDIARDFRSGT